MATDREIRMTLRPLYPPNPFPLLSVKLMEAQRHLAQLGVLDELDRMGPEGGADVDAIELFSMRSDRQRNPHDSSTLVSAKSLSLIICEADGADCAART
jgi:hypothetical protein